jgi:hypothetical protein
MPRIKTLVKLSGEPWEEIWALPKGIDVKDPHALEAYAKKVIEDFNSTSITPKEKLRRLVKVLEVLSDEEAEQKDLEQAVTELGYEALKGHLWKLWRQKDEVPFPAFQKKIDELTLEQLRTLLAYEEWKNGMEWKDVIELWVGAAFLYDTRETIMDRLVNVYGF